MIEIIFHLAFPVTDISQTKAFYADGLGCRVGRETPKSVILDLAGNQLVAHVVHQMPPAQRGIYPRHFGLVFRHEVEWERLLARAQSTELSFYQQPKRRFRGSPLEHRTFFLADPFENLLEFKFYCYESAIFGEAQLAEVGDA